MLLRLNASRSRRFLTEVKELADMKTKIGKPLKCGGREIRLSV